MGKITRRVPFPIFALSLTVTLLISGCNNKNEQNEQPKLENSVSIYATSAGNYGRAFMLSRAYSSNVDTTILAIGLGGPEYPFEYTSINNAQFNVTPLETNFDDISQTIMDEHHSDMGMDLYLGVIPVTDGELLTADAFSNLDNIYLVPEGTGLLEYSADRIDNIILFANKAKEYGVKNIKLILWDSISKKALLESDLAIAKLESNGVDYEFISFNDMSKDIKMLDTGSALLSTAFYSGAIEKSALIEPIFTESQTFNEDNENAVFIGSYTKDDPNISYVNQSDILTELESDVDLENYNLIFKGHPRETSVNDWIDDNSNSISYFKSFPYEIWQVLDGGEYTYMYDNLEYQLTLPRAPSIIYSIMSTMLYGEDSNKMQVILGYSAVSSSDELTNESTPYTESSKKVYEKWTSLTNNIDVPFKMTYDWINED